MKLNKSEPPKDREFLGLVDCKKDSYWEIFFWATPEYGARKCCFTDRQLLAMPKLKGWVELPDTK